MTTPIPVAVVGGYLGAGKTTLVNHVLRHAQGMRLAVLVNDFGSLPIDAGLIESQASDVISLAGGCICCSFGSDLMGTLMALSDRVPVPDHVLIETSGVAIPGSVVRSVALLSSFRVRRVVVVVDAKSIIEQAADRYVGSTIERQLRDANLVVLNKIDLVSTDATEPLHAWLAFAAPGVERRETTHGMIPLEALFADGHNPQPRGLAEMDDADAHFESEAFVPDGPVDVAALAGALLACDVVRAKGVLLDLDGALKVLQVASGRHVVTPCERTGRPVTGLVCIALRGRMDRARLRDAFALAMRPAMPRRLSHDPGLS